MRIIDWSSDVCPSVRDDAALPRSAASRYHVEQGRLAGTVRADEAESLAWVEGQVEAPEEPAVAVAVAHAVQLDHLVAEPRRLDVQRQATGAIGRASWRGRGWQDG